MDDAERTLRDCRILVIEDEYLLADDLRAGLSALDAVVLGPIGTVDGALALIRDEQRIDGAIMDINLCGEMGYAAADLLRERGVPFLFATGYDRAAIPDRFADVQRCEKPVSLRAVARALGRSIHG